MRIIDETYNDQNINRVYTKMCERFSGQNNNAKLSNSVENLNYLHNLGSGGNNKDRSNFNYNHMYNANAENGEINLPSTNCQDIEREVKFLKEWLLLHLDLIQQQNDEILSKDKTILLLQQENEMLKERIKCFERGTLFRPNKIFNHNSNLQHVPEENAKELAEDPNSAEYDNKSNIQLLELNCNDVNRNIDEFTRNEIKHQTTCATNIEQTPNCDVEINVNVKQEVNTNTESNDAVKPTSDDTNLSALSNSLINFNSDNFTVNNASDTDIIKNLRMSIRRKRLCSNSSLLSNNDSDEKRHSRKVRKKRKNSIKNEQILTYQEQYVTQTGESNVATLNELEIPASNLEVPRWRVKVYTSCYTMEGTENLDDEVYNKRHSRLENDERRRKRWDVQRIREQRIIEKLKQRQERIGSGSRDEQCESPHSLWPTLDDVRYLEVCDQLPVSAFGCPIPRFIPNEFSLPWLINPHISVKKTSRKSIARRKAAKR